MSAPADLTEALIQAIDRDDLGAVEDLIAQGADVNALDANGLPLILLAELRLGDWNYYGTAPEGEKSGHTRSILRALVEAGADIDARDADGNTMLMRAAEARRPVRPYVDLGADINAKNKLGASALGHACFFSQVHTVSELLDCGADPNVRNAQGNTPMTGLRSPEGMEIALMLLDAGADVRARNLAGETPDQTLARKALEIKASASSRSEIAELLRSRREKLELTEALGVSGSGRRRSRSL